MLENVYYSGSMTSKNKNKLPELLYNKLDYNGKIDIKNFFYNSDKFKETVPDGCNPLTTSQFADKSNFTGWDFENTWVMKDGHPELRIFQ